MLLDTMMPVLDGPSMAQLWRQMEQRMGLPRATIITVTAVDGGKCEHVDGHLKKPLLFGDLQAFFEKHKAGNP